MTKQNNLLTVEYCCANTYRAPKTNERLVGIEIEVEHCAPLASAIIKATKEKCWETRNDDSLRDGGVEFVSHPIPIEKVPSAIRSLYDAGGNFWKSSPRTGIHVHIDCRDFTVQDIKSLIVTYSLLEPALFNFIGAEREENIFCVPWYRASTDIRQASNGMLDREEITDVLSHFDYSLCKYSALFMQPLSKYGTVEFRHAPTWDNASKVINWAFACHELVSFAKANSAESVYARFKNGGDLFPYFVLGPNFACKNYEDLVKSKDCEYLVLEFLSKEGGSKWNRMRDKLPDKIKLKNPDVQTKKRIKITPSVFDTQVFQQAASAAQQQMQSQFIAQTSGEEVLESHTFSNTLDDYGDVTFDDTEPQP